VHPREEMERLQCDTNKHGTHLFSPRIVEEVSSIRFNQEQQNVILHKYTSKSATFLSEPPEGANKQDLITALVSREKVRAPFPT
jgi:hypothetical protein